MEIYAAFLNEEVEREKETFLINIALSGHGNILTRARQ